jgi:hypothetical protein
MPKVSRHRRECQTFGTLFLRIRLTNSKVVNPPVHFSNLRKSHVCGAALITRMMVRFDNPLPVKRASQQHTSALDVSFPRILQSCSCRGAITPAFPQKICSAIQRRTAILFTKLPRITSDR